MVFSGGAEESAGEAKAKFQCRDLIFAGASIPVSLLIFVVGKVYSRATNHNDFTLTPWRSFLCTLFPFIMCIYGFKKKSVNLSGAIFGIAVAIVLSIASPVYLVTLAAFFFSSSKATKYRQDVKKKIEKDFKVGGQRNWLQVLCNGGVGAFLALAHLIECGVGERPVDFENEFIVSFLGVAVMAAFACCNGDTWASELGILSKSDPKLITTFKSVPRGTNGGISSWGLFVSFAGGIFIGIFYYLATILFVDSESLLNAPSQYPIIFLGGLAGLFGSLVDSFLGATCQFSGQTADGFIVEDPKEAVKKISGKFRILNNHTVNLVSCIITAAIIPGLGTPIWSFFAQTTD